MGDFFSVRNYDEFQHYKDRSPPWIKLYHDLMDNYKFATLPDQTKYHLVAIWLLASRNNNKLPNDATWIAGRINATGPVDLNILFEKEFLTPIELGQDASKALAGRKQNAPLAEERRGEESDASKDASKVFAYWQEVMNKPNAKLTKDRFTRITARLREGYTVDDLMGAILGCSMSEFHMGRNDRQTEYNDLITILKNGNQVEKMRDLVKSAPTADRRLSI